MHTVNIHRQHPCSAVIPWLIIGVLWATLIGQLSASELILDRYWVLTGIENFEPSGLSFCGDTLVVVSDRHDNKVYEIPLTHSIDTVIKPYRSFQIEDATPSQMSWKTRLTDLLFRWTDKRYDWEGVHCDPQKNLYLVSESLSAIASVDQRGELSWETPSFSDELRQHGFLSQLNTGFEGIVAHQNLLIAAIEREPRGLMVINGQTDQATIEQIELINNEGVLSPLAEDFTGLWLESTQLYTLERNYFRVCKRHYTEWTIDTCWGYYHIEKSADYRFHDDQYGMAEGIARKGSYLYIVLDNNQSLRLTTQQSAPLLFRFLLPTDW